MCQAIKFHINDHLITFRFTDLKACLPVRMQNGNIMLVPWGRKEPGHPSYPIGNTAHLDRVRAQQWRHYWPKFVQIACEAYLLMNKEGQEQWYDLKPVQYIKGLVATAFGDDRVYILMRNPEILDPEGHTEWPVLNYP